MASVRESSQQDRRVYVGNLSYDVKWHHLKDFMRQGTEDLKLAQSNRICLTSISGGGSFCRCAIASEWNVEGGRLRVMPGFPGFVFGGRMLD